VRCRNIVRKINLGYSVILGGGLSGGGDKENKQTQARNQ
jgi:hypothetical protein